MESLALIVAILFVTAILSGPIALGLTYIHAQTARGRKFLRVFISLFGIWGVLNGLQFAIANVPIFPRLIGLMSVITSVFAIKREFKLHRKLHEE